jgi:hypothetical protein
MQAHEFMRRVGTVLRTTNDDFTHAPLPERWVDLIHYLDEKERRESRATAAKEEVASAGRGCAAQAHPAPSSSIPSHE